MPSTYSDLKLQLMATGENNTTWGDVTNINWEAIEEALAGSTNIVFASADVTLTLANSNAPQPARNMRLVLTGTTGGATRTLTIPAITKMYTVLNNCADPIIVTTGAGNSATVPSLKGALLFCDGVNLSFSTNFAGTMQVGNGLAGVALPNGRLVVSERLGVGTTNPLGIAHVAAAADGQNNFVVTGLTKGVRIVPLATYTIIQGVDNTIATPQPLVLEGTTLQMQASTPAKGININAAGDTTAQGSLTVVNGLFANGVDNVTLAAFTGLTNRLRFYSSAASGNVVDSTNASGAAYAPFVLGATQLTLIAQPANKGIVIDTSGNVTATSALNVTGSVGIGGVIDVTGITTLRSTVNILGSTYMPNGTLAVPSLGFTSESNTGLYRKSAGIMGIVAQGVLTAEVSNAGFNFLALPKYVGQELWLRDQPVTGGNGAPFNLTLAHRGQLIQVNGGAPSQFVIPAQASVAWPVGSTIEFYCWPGVGTIEGAPGVTIFWAGSGSSAGGTRTFAIQAYAKIVRVTQADVWFISGVGIT